MTYVDDQRTNRNGNLTKNLEEQLLSVLEQDPQKAWNVNDLLYVLNQPITSRIAREVIWDLIDRDKIELMENRNLRFLHH